MEKYIHEIPCNKVKLPIKKQYDIVIIGGGISGICAAISAARNGSKVALIHARSVYGGNASSETRMHISGASCHWGKKNAAETGILMELQLENKYLNPNHNFSIWDGVLWSKIRNENNIDEFMNTSMYEVLSDDKNIQSVLCYQYTTESKYEFKAKIFIDATGDGTLGYFAGAEYRVGREDKTTFKEKDAPEKKDGETMGNTIYFCARDMGKKVDFIKPSWAHTFDESFFKYRYHGDTVVYHDADKVVELKPGEDYSDHSDQLVEKYDVHSGYWWIELGGDYKDIIKESEDIRYELYKTVYGVWDHIKNQGDHGADNFDLVWVGCVSGTRESRRLMGAYVLTENDILENKIFDDGIAYGGWPMDEHVAGGFKAKSEIPSRVRSFPGLFSIPFGCYYSSNIDNLMMAGRNISCSKLAMGSTRVMATCAVGAEAVGIAASMIIKNNCSISDFEKYHIQELRQNLLKNDCYIIGLKNQDAKDFARVAELSATSEKTPVSNIINGVTRNTENQINYWSSDGISDSGEVVSIKLDKSRKITSIRVTFDPDLSEERCITVSKAFIDKQPKGVDKTLIKDYKIIFYKENNLIYEKEINGNYQRLNVISLEKSIEADMVNIIIKSTHGSKDAHIFEVRIY